MDKYVNKIKYIYRTNKTESTELSKERPTFVNFTAVVFRRVSFLIAGRPPSLQILYMFRKTERYAETE